MFKEERLNIVMIKQHINKNLFTDISTPLLDLINKYQDKKNTLENEIKKIENEYLVRIDEIKTYENNEETFNNLTSLELLTKELELIKIILQYSLSNNELELSFITKSLTYLLNISNILKKRLNQEDIEIIDNNELSRCSYKFCTFKENCNYYYNKKSSHKCYQDHYVHNMVSHDIINLLKYINKNYKDDEKIKQNKEILKTLNTLSFVINHMDSELRAKCIYLDKSEWEKFH